MLGLIVLAVFGFYILLSLFVIVFVAKAAINSGKSPWRWGVGTALFMYLIVFYDHIPTILLHKYYCATKAGIWVHKTPEQWKAENPESAGKLTWRDNSPFYNAPGYSRAYRLNERFVWAHILSKTFILPVTIDNEYIFDIETGEILVEQVSVGAGYGSFPVGGETWQVIKFWVKRKPCMEHNKEFGALIDEYHQMGDRLDE